MTMPHLSNCPHSDDGWCLECVQTLEAEWLSVREMAERAMSENERARKHATEMWSECVARGEILDAIQKEAEVSWWYGALYQIQYLRKEANDYRRTHERHAKRIGKLEAERAEMLDALKAAYISGNRDGWQDGPTTEEAMKQVLTALCNAGVKVLADGTLA